MRFAKPVIAVSLCLCAAAAAAQTLSTEEDKTLYAVGLALGRNIENFGLTPAELALVTSGISDAALKKKPKVDLDTYGPKIQGLAQQRMSANATVEKKASAAFLEQMAKQPGAQREASGVIYIPEKEGTGEMPTAESTVKVNYHGTLRDGTVFDSSVQRGQPVTFPLNQVISCWTQGVQKMKVGGKAKLGCPSDTAYGDTGQGPIPGGAALVFEVELLDIEKQ